MALSLVSVFEATNDLGAALDETLLVSDDKLRSNLAQVEADLKALLRNEEASLVREPPKDLLDEQMALVERLREVSSQAETLENSCTERMGLWQDKIDDIKANEERLAELEDTLGVITTLKQALLLRNSITSSVQVDARVEAVLQLSSLAADERLAKTRIQKWMRSIIDSHVPKLRTDIESELAGAIKPLKWPLPAADFNNPHVTTIGRCLNLLARLQVAILCLDNHVVKELTDDLWGIQVLARPFVVRFRYHFSLDHATNRVDRPEWFVLNITEAVGSMAPLIESKLQPALSSLVPLCTEGRLGDEDRVFVDLLSQFIRVMVRLAHKRLESTWDVIERDDGLICHTMDELLSGDRILMGEFGYGSSNVHWPTLSSFFYQSERCIDAWLRADLRYARERMRESISSPNSWKTLRETLHISSAVDFSSATSGDYTTECSDAVMSMIEALGSRTDLCRGDLNLSENEHGNGIKVEFAEKVQGTLIREFVTIATERNDLGERLNTLQSILDILMDWKLKPRYVDLNKSTRNQARLFLFRGRDLVKRVSGASKEEDSHSDGGNDEVWVFEPIVDHVRSVLKFHVESEATKAVQAFNNAIRDYERKNWIRFVENSNVGEVSDELRSALSVLRTYIDSWMTQLNPLSRLAAASYTAQDLQRIFLGQVSKIRTLSVSAAHQLRVDVEAFIDIFTKIIPNPRRRLLAKLDAVCMVLAANEAELARLLESRGDPEILGLSSNLSPHTQDLLTGIAKALQHRNN